MSTPPEYLRPPPDYHDEAEHRRQIALAVVQSLDRVEEVNARVSASGATGDRPASPVTGEPFFDTTLNIPIWYNGTAWVNAQGVAV